jgi:hypothetical protein
MSKLPRENLNLQDKGGSLLREAIDHHLRKEALETVLITLTST